MAKHTRGPWIIPSSPDFQNHPFHIQDENGYAICDMAAEYSSIESYDEHKANAKLIAAAPELLDALYTALPFIEDALKDECYKTASVRGIIKRIHTVISKATGA